MILLVGARGNMGRRYAAIFNYLGKTWDGVDVGDKWPDGDYSHIMICTPTPLHVEHIIDARVKYPNASIMVEKPIALTLEAAKMVLGLTNAYIVNNWAHTSGVSETHEKQSNNIKYDYYNTGPHGLVTDCCQLVYLAKSMDSCVLRNNSPYFRAIINGVYVSMDCICFSYISMVKAWLAGKTELLWDMNDAIEQMRLVEEYKRYHNV